MKIVDGKMIIITAVTFSFLLLVFFTNNTSSSYALSLNVPKIDCFNKSLNEDNALELSISSTNSGNNYSYELINVTLDKTNNLAGSTTSYTYQNLEKGKEYTIILRACSNAKNDYSCSAWTKPFTAVAGDIPEIDIVAKPIIYLYPEKETELFVRLGNSERVTVSYPEYKDGWHVIAKPDGKLIDVNTGRSLYSLYWEGIQDKKLDIKDGFVVKGSDTVKFLEEKLDYLGLSEREAEEFIVYWLPKLQNNKYNYIRFATMEEINENMPLEFSEKPDTIIRVLMQFKALDSEIKVKPQKLISPERKGFVAVEWGGTEIK